MHLKWHFIVPLGIVGSIQTTDTMYTGETSFALAYVGTTTEIGILSILFILGSVAADAGGIGYKIGAYLRDEQISILQSRQWDQRQTTLFEILDLMSWWSIAYKFPHSLFGTVVSFSVMTLCCPVHWCVAYFTGHLLHLTMDYPTHRVCWLLWPFKILYPGTDWWKVENEHEES